MITESHKVTAIMNLIRMVVIIAVMQTHPVPVQCFGLQALKQHLDLNHLRHCIIVQTTPLAAKDNKSIWLPWNSFKDENLMLSLINQYYIRFYYVNSKKKDFNQFFYHESPPVGLFMYYPSAAIEEEEMTNFLISASNNDRFNSSCSWLIVMEDKIGNPLAMIRSLFGHLNVMLNADVTVGIVRENSTLDLYDVYKVCFNCATPLVVNFKGKWSLHSGFELLDDYKESFVRRRSNFQNISIKVGTIILNKNPLIDDMEYLENYQHYMQNDSMQRKTYQLLKMLQPLYKFTFSIQLTNAWGVHSNGTWNGLMALLTEHKVAFTICPMRYTIERLRDAIISPELHMEKVSFLLRHPKRASIRNIFFEPLDNTVWWCILALIVITTLLLAIHVRTEYQLYWQMQRQSGRSTERHLDIMLLTILEAIFMQGPSPERFHNNSTRLLLVSVSVFSVLLIQFYGAFIVSSMLSEPPRTMTNLAALYNSSFEIGMEDIPYNYDIFSNPANQLARNIYKQRICNQQTSHIMTLEQGVEHITRGKFALHVAVDRAYRLLKTALAQTEFCDLQEITLIPPLIGGIGLVKSSPYKEFISTAILKFREVSLLQYNDRRWKIPKIDCSAIRNAEIEVDVVSFAPVLVFLAVATTMATSCCLAEFFYKRVENHIKHKYAVIGQTMSDWWATNQRL